MINNFLFDSLLIDEYDKFVENLYNFSSLIDTPNELGETLLHFSAFYGIIDKYYALINFGANVILTKEYNNLLHYASFSGNDDFLIVELIKNNINPLELNNEQETVLHLCANERTAHYLNLWCQRNKIKLESLLDRQGNTILHSAYQYGFLKTADYWKNAFPTLITIKNNQQQLWNEIPHKNKFFCKG